MTTEFWWTLLGGFLLGLSVSTLWEWIFFRRKRMRMENKEIEELRRQVQTLKQSSDWAAGRYQDPGVARLENEQTTAVIDDSVDETAGIRAVGSTTTTIDQASEASDQPTISPEQIQELVKSIQELIDTVDPEHSSAPAATALRATVAGISSATLSATATNTYTAADELTLIPGLTPQYAQKLRQAGVTSFRELAGRSSADLAQIIAVAPREPQPDYDGWIKKAKVLVEP